MKPLAIFLDLDDTLFPTSRFAEKARRNAIRAMIREGLPVKEKAAYARLVRTINVLGPNYGHHFDVLVREALGKGNARMVAAGIGAYHDTRKSIKPFPGVRETLGKLKNKHSLYVVSEGMPVKQWDKLIRLGIQRMFANVFVTGSGRRKNVRFYESALRRAGVKSGESLMVGDKCERDIMPAREAGMATCHAALLGQQRCKEADFCIRSFSGIMEAIKELEG